MDWVNIYIIAILYDHKSHSTRIYIHTSLSFVCPHPDGSEGIATRNIRAIRAIRVQKKTHHSRELI